MKHRKQKHHEWWMMPAKRMIKPWSMVNILVDGEKVTARINGVLVRKLDVSNSLNCTKQMCIDIYGNVYCGDVYYNAKKSSAWSLKSVAFPEVNTEIVRYISEATHITTQRLDDGMYQHIITL